MKSESLAACRVLKWSRMKKKSTQRIPPDEESHQLKISRGNYQSYLFNNYKNKENIPYPIGHGWCLTNGTSVFSSESPFFLNFTCLLISLVTISFIIVHIQRILHLDFRQMCSCSSHFATTTTRIQANDGNSS